MSQPATHDLQVRVFLEVILHDWEAHELTCKKGLAQPIIYSMATNKIAALPATVLYASLTNEELDLARQGCGAPGGIGIYL